MKNFLAFFTSNHFVPLILSWCHARRLYLRYTFILASFRTEWVPALNAVYVFGYQLFDGTERWYHGSQSLFQGCL